jgi:hypothetical protein
MEKEKVDTFMMMNAKYFESHQMHYVRDLVSNLDDSKAMIVQTLQFKDPTMILIVSIFAGNLAIDRFLIGDTGLGVGKLLTCGGLGIWAIVDWFLIMPATRERNLEMLQRAVGAGGWQ